jgi:hypothetical protein
MITVNVQDLQHGDILWGKFEVDYVQDDGKETTVFTTDGESYTFETFTEVQIERN